MGDRVQTRVRRSTRGRTAIRGDWRYSVAAMWDHMGKAKSATKQDPLTAVMKELAELKERISVESKKNFALEKENRTLDQKIGLLVKNRITLEEAESAAGDYKALSTTRRFQDEGKRQYYENLFYLLAADTRYMATLAYEAKLEHIDSLLHTVMFTLFGNQYEAHDEHMLLILFEMVLAKVYEDAKEKGSLMRANTAITRMMTTYTRRGPGQDYLKSTLTDLLSWICREESMSMEVNPMKIYDQIINEYETETGEKSPLPRSVPYEELIGNEEVKKKTAERIPKLLETAQKFLDAIIASCDQVPYGMRWICKQIGVLTMNKFPDASRYERSSLIGGFFLLRYVNPSIVTPHSFMLIPVKPGPVARRNLTYIAKLIQNLSNFVGFGEKEPYMAPLNVFVESNKEKMCDFFERLCDVEDPKDFLEMDEYLELSRTTVPQITISLNEVYLMHALISNSVQTLTEDDEDDPLATIMRDLGEPPAQVPRAENGTVTLQLVDRFEEEEEAGIGDDKHIVASQRYSESKALLFNLYRAVPELVNIENPSLTKALQGVKQRYGADRSGDYQQDICELVDVVLLNLTLLNEAGLVSAADNYERIRSDVQQELSHMERKLERLRQQRDKLNGVLENIKEHTSFLLQTHESYEAYLDNVRDKAYKQKGKEKGKEKSSKKGKKFTFCHTDLEKKGIILDSDVPEERRAFVFFTFTSGRPGVFTILGMYKGQGRTKELFENEIKLDDLLEQQHRNELELELDYTTLSVNMLAHLLKKTFIS